MGIVHNPTIQKRKRQYLRNNATKAERMLWQRLKAGQIGYKFRRQHGIKQYIVDFYCPELRLMIEIDGSAHNFSQQQKHDFLRERKLEKLNFKVVRYNNNDIIENLDNVIINLKNICESLK